MKCSVFIATSLDGYIAREDGRIDWLEEAHRSAPPGDDFGYQEFFDTVDVLILGRKTFETVWGFPEWPYGEKRVVVLSQTLHQLPADCPPSVRIASQAPAEIVKSLERESFRRAYVDGGSTIQSFLAAGLVSDLTITSIPILLGSGIRLFGPLPEDLPLIHESTRAYPNGFVQTTYRVG
ncbi:bifunctional deaminase-reductase domain protein [Planctopirus limnophila DSM 3776]|uniref:Bifunctional deaminase-reductase domain protein n=1 Tax=Planctopirus limnophila (strain ATCC 43296 / DSM 3776 / IFAM 1008 / Mu 290) TaxID=521674 RepID=D5SWD4_PLAL2|nr:dihydrofolate reductase family protein [Planctopirus limnophila]ADG69527.1 bifunctional deaminase-reductase domain protein [Planctopirus limnophila DSM 3776]